MGDGQGIDHRAQHHQNPDRNEHRNGDLAGEGGTGQQGFVGVDAQGDDTQVVIVADDRHEHIGHLAIGGQVLADQGIVGSLLQVGGKLEAAAEQLIAGTAGPPRTHRDAQVEETIGIGEEDVAQAAAGAPKLFGDDRQLAIIAAGHQRGDVGREQQAQVAGIAGVAESGIALNTVEGKEGDARHQQADHQGAHRQQFGLEAEFSPPTAQPGDPGRAGAGGASGSSGRCHNGSPAGGRRTWWPMSRR